MGVSDLLNSRIPKEEEEEVISGLLLLLV